MMYPLLWMAIAGLGGIATILGGLMALGSLLLWIAPAQPARTRKPPHPSSQTAPGNWQNRLKVTAFSVALVLVGLSLLIIAPFPQT